ncbi:DNA-binding GntR family transcriptional regulator [Nocardia transvalensis]|uniref:DNA-binding GntR family transcriptional regulator n=1 Tax=Nocardia transvalensis TaxID=37333 RepID=A0A7W9PBH4_9NOCA|nr:GntR family transcriptional regulator [Nocardia transvalensis]MBB5912673.1 DNA-binding GntR family transcriptional regulator [Nocardia transvalensis]
MTLQAAVPGHARLPRIPAGTRVALHRCGPGLPPLRARVRDLMRDWVVDGRLAPGMRLYEQDIAAALGISRVPIREAIRMLEAEGYVTVHNRQVRVRALDPASVAHLFDVCETLEALATRQAAEAITPAGARRLRDLLEAGRAELDGGGRPVSDGVNMALHEEISRLAGNDVLDGLITPLRGRVQCLLRHSGDGHRIFGEHAAITEAVATGDAARAADLAAAHMRATRRDVLAHLPGSGGRMSSRA